MNVLIGYGSFSPHTSQYSGASYQKNMFLLIKEAMECAGMLLTKSTVCRVTPLQLNI
jgi:hypothetical protein